MDIHELIIATLKEKIDEKGLKYKELAEMAGYQQSYISKIINGNVQKIGIDTLGKLLLALDMSLSTFFLEVEKKTLKPVLI